jgi:hypothetical protein
LKGKKKRQPYLQFLSIVLKLGPTGRPETQPTRGWNQARLKKKQGKEKTGVTQRAEPARHGQKLGCNPLTFVFFFTKTTSF